MTDTRPAPRGGKARHARAPVLLLHRARFAYNRHVRQDAAMWVGVLGAVLASTRPARADLARVRLAVLHTAGTEGCLVDTEVRADVTARLGRDPFDASALRSIDVVLSRDAAAYAARIYTREDPAGTAATRTLTSNPDDCPRLRASVNLAVALAIDPDAPLAPATPPTVLPHSPAPLPSPAPGPVRPPVRPPDPRAWDRSDRLALRAVIAVGPLPAPAPAVSIGFESGRPGWLRGSFGALRTFEVLTSDGAFGFSLTAFWAALCAGTADARWSVSACLGAQAGFAAGVVHNLVGLVPVRPGDYGWLAVIAPVRGAVRIVDPVVVELSAEPYVAVLRQSFRVQQ
ncbi:MAG: hypothetical protein WCJ30_15220, partial [Deltaproteobacteria bacterium]